jgi:hypothetical protein
MIKFSRKSKSLFLSLVLFSLIPGKEVFSKKLFTNSSEVTYNPPSLTGLSALYGRLNLDVMGLSREAFNYALSGYEKLRQAGKITNDRIITIIDFTKSSSSKRLFVIDLEKELLLFNTYVAHGQNSGKAYATQFSNIPESLQSSLGFYQTSETYIGKHGYSMQLIGLENGINDKANERAIVLHGAEYVSEQLIRAQGYIGRSWGCPAVPEKYSKPIINAIKNGSCLFIYASDKNYLKKSRLIFG